MTSAGDGWSSLELRPDVGLAAEGAMPDLPPDLAALVAAAWDAARLRHPALFNGRVFCADQVTPSRIVGHWTEYRRVVAQMRRPDLFNRLRIRSLAVNGLIECDDGLVLGQRHADAAYLPGCWQAAPAGAVEARDGIGLDLGGQLMAELREELGLDAQDVVRALPVAAIEHAGSHVVDVGFLLRVAAPFRAVQALHARLGNHEYRRLRLVRPDELDGLLRAPDPALLPSARMLMARWRAG